MSTYTALTEKGESFEFSGVLLDEEFEEHQVEIRTPINTESVALYRTDDDKYILTIQFQFEEMDPHHHEIHIGSSPQEILTSLGYPTDATKILIERVLSSSSSSKSETEVVATA